MIRNTRILSISLVSILILSTCKKKSDTADCGGGGGYYLPDHYMWWIKPI